MIPAARYLKGMESGAVEMERVSIIPKGGSTQFLRDSVSKPLNAIHFAVHVGQEQDEVCRADG